MTSPGGRQIVISLESIGKQSFEIEQTRILFYLGEPTPYSRIQEYYFDFIGNPYVANGIWQLEIRGIRIRDGKLRMYLPSDAVLNQGIGFSAYSHRNLYHTRNRGKSDHCGCLSYGVSGICRFFRQRI